MPIIIKKKAAAAVVAEPIKTQLTRPANDFDGQCLVVLSASPNAAVSWWLMASFAADHRGVALLSKKLYREIAAAMLDAWGELEHQHKHLITQDDLVKGHLQRLNSGDYPTMVAGAVDHLLRTK